MTSAVTRGCTGRAPVAVLLALTWAIAPAAARADSIDLELDKHAPRLMEYLQKQGYQNVGVLKFRVQQGDQGDSFNAGPLNTNMAGRLENALIVKNDVKQPIGVIRDASRVAAERKLQDSYTTASGRRALFSNPYPLAWGKTEVKADAFLAGRVSISRDNRQAHVSIEAFDDKGADLKELENFSVRTDRTLLADAGKSFLVAMRGNDDDAAESATVVDRSLTATLGQSRERYVDLEIRYNGKKMQPVVRRGKGASIPAPAVGSIVQLRITNVSKIKVGVVLAINGVNTLYEEKLAERPPVLCTKYILDPKESYEINGFYQNVVAGQKNVKLFKVTDDLSRLDIYGDQFGMIHLSVFGEGDPKDQVVISGPSFRGLSRRQLQQDPPQSFAELQFRLVRQMLAQHPSEKMAEELLAIRAKALKEWQASPLATKGGAIIPQDKAEDTAALIKVSFKNPRFIMEENIRYFDPQAASEK